VNLGVARKKQVASPGLLVYVIDVLPVYYSMNRQATRQNILEFPSTDISSRQCALIIEVFYISLSSSTVTAEPANPDS